MTENHCPDNCSTKDTFVCEACGKELDLLTTKAKAKVIVNFFQEMEDAEYFLCDRFPWKEAFSLDELAELICRHLGISINNDH